MLLNEDFLAAHCEVKTMSNQLLAAGILLEIGDGELSVGVKRNSKETMPLIPYSTRVKLVVYRRGNEPKTYCGIVYVSNEFFARMTQVEQLADYEKRNFFRVNVAMHTSANFRNAQTGAMEAVAVDIKDISLGGLAFCANHAFRVGQHLEILLSLLDAKEYYFECKVVRIVPAEDGGSPIYGCSFENVADNTSADLCAFLFQQQRLELHRKRHSL